MKPLDGAELELVCPCGYENFERVVVMRGTGAVVTDFVACVGCKAVYFSPLRKPDPAEVRPGHRLGAYGPPPPPRTWADDTSASLKRDAEEAAKDYVKPGRHTPPRKRSG
jgi:hypothetical protein